MSRQLYFDVTSNYEDDPAAAPRFFWKVFVVDPKSPKLVVVDKGETETAEAAEAVAMQVILSNPALPVDDPDLPDPV